MWRSPRNIWGKPTAWLTSDTWGLKNSPIFLNAALVRDRRSLGDTNQETAFWIPSSGPVSVAVTAHHPSCGGCHWEHTCCPPASVGTTLVTFTTGVHSLHLLSKWRRRGRPGNSTHSQAAWWGLDTTSISGSRFWLTSPCLKAFLGELNFHSFRLGAQACCAEFCKVAWKHHNIKTQSNSLPSKYAITSFMKITFFILAAAITYSNSP